MCSCTISVMTSLTPRHFIGEPIDAIFDQPPTLEKKPPCPNAFVWQGQTVSHQ